MTGMDGAGTKAPPSRSFESAATGEAAEYIAEFLEIIKSRDENKLIQLAEYEDLNLFPQITEKLVQLKATSVNTILAARGLILAGSELATLLLARDPAVSVRLELTNNIPALVKWPSAVLVLAQDPDETIRSRISPELLKVAVLKIAKEGRLQQKIDLANNPIILQYPEAAAALFRDKNEKLQKELPKNVLRLALHYLALNGTETEKIAIADKWDLREYPNITEILSRDPSESVRLELASNINALIHNTAAALTLLGDKYEAVSEKVAEHENLIRGLANNTQQESVVLSLIKSKAVMHRYPDLIEKFSDPINLTSIRFSIASNVQHLIFVTQARGEKTLENLRVDADISVRHALKNSLCRQEWLNAFRNIKRLQLLGATLGTEQARSALIPTAEKT